MNIFRFITKDRQLLKRSGKLDLYENVFIMKRAESGEKNLVYIDNKDIKYLTPLNENISITEAHERTGISKDRLRKLSRDGTISAKKGTNRQWLVSWKSLVEYLNPQ